MASEINVDALPCIDQGYDDSSILEVAISMVEDEKRNYRPSKNYLEHLPALNISVFETEMMRAEFDRLERHLPVKIMNMKRYELLPPPAGQLADMSAWNDCLENSMAQLKNQATRITNLRLMTDYDIDAWESYLEVIIKCITALQTQVTKLKKLIKKINFQQLNVQLQITEQSRELKANWVALVNKYYEIELACANLEKQIRTYESAKPQRMNTAD
ncbi:pre-mRNA-splicing factor SPF27-like [Rhopalosiphum maidis]|uniref:pre-mRNA-splicing factor SPF27-like n=1 Tax=Rhopalosiphum maidis TaxID=43146 RepID=UPI000F009947|nr:pre-mRNA-splicing factor SPF27-like [Rhopalosiphum maidis]XP_026820002.1 pre-mRNA-splicing factor SPF27-like [Rhopalosiphum maidis]XP_026820003.1 pre-mRNA-splicing factor SPF27-like [Rhopalosiphum maidis]XP_026820004.1 pre-mRNA-splicing factor SPF27-like [Rhopalosiphum maidis]